ncbi:MAG: hypothetical protein WAN05_25655, partial [Roseiarcus sp.]
LYSFVGSVNDSASAFRHSYEILWGDDDAHSAEWVREEFEHFWGQGVDLPDAVVKHVAAMANRIEYRSIEEARGADGSIPVDAVLAERPIYKGGQILRSWQNGSSRLASMTGGCTARRATCSRTTLGSARPCRWRRRLWFSRCSTTSRC